MGFPVEKIAGVMPALITPYGMDGFVNVAMVRRLVTYHMEQGCHGFFDT